jgi:hypothetical protein
MTKRKMGGLGKLSQFSGIKPQKETIQDTETPSAKVDEENTKNKDASPDTDKETTPIKNRSTKSSQKSSKSKNKNQEKLVTVNIKITKSQKDWLAQTATQVRDNNTEPVPPAERVYPQHLIGVAINLLKEAEVDWTQVKNVEDLREQLNL